jgi:copper chaperone CopZ
MKVQLLTFPGCPNAEPTRAAMRAAMQRLSLPLTIEEIDLTAPSTPEPLRGWSSPTILVDGADLEGQPRPGDGSACRLYGGRGGAPPVDEIERRLRARLSTEAAPASRRAERVAVGGAIVAAFAASACCVGPALLALVGISGIGFAAALEPYRLLLLVATGALLAVGFYVSYRTPRSAARDRGSVDACGCERPRVARSGRWMLWGGTVLAVAFAAYPYVTSAFAHSSATGAAATNGTAVARLHVGGMTCRACSSHLTDALAGLPGVVRAEVSYDDALAVVTYDPSKTKPQAFVELITRSGYQARVESTDAASR